METKKLKEEIIDFDIKNKHLLKKIDEIDKSIIEYEQNKLNFNFIQNFILILFPFFAAIIDILLGGIAIGKLLENVPLEGLKIIKICIVALTIVIIELGLGLMLYNLSKQNEQYSPPFKIFKIISYAFIFGVPFLASTEIIYLFNNIDNPVFAAFSLFEKIIQYFAFVILSSSTHFYLLFNARRITSSYSNMQKYFFYLFQNRRRRKNVENVAELSTKMFSLLTNLIVIDTSFNVEDFPITELTKDKYYNFYNN